LQANTASPQLVGLTTQQPRIAALASAPGAGLIATGASDGSIRLWRPGSGQAITRVTAPASSGITAIALDGNELVVGDAAGQVGLYSLSARSWTWPVQSQGRPITAVGVDAAGAVVASASSSSSGVSAVELSRAIRDAPAARVTVSPVLGSPVTRLVFGGASRFVVGGATGQEFVWSLTPPSRYLGTSTQLTATDGGNIGAYSPDMTGFGVSGRGVSGAYLEATRPTPFQPPSSRQIQFPATAPNPPLAIALAPAGRRLAASGGTGVTVLDALGTGGANAALATTTLTGLANPDLLAFPDQDHIVGTDGSTIAVWDLRQLSRIAQVSASPLGRISEAVQRMPTAASPDGRHATWVAPVTPQKLACWNVGSLRELRSQPLGGVVVSSVAYNPAGTLLATGAGSIQLWQVHGGCPAQKTRSVTAASDAAVGFRDARTVVAVGGDNTIRIIDASSGGRFEGSRAVFLRVRAPAGALSAGGVISVVAQACVRAGVPPVGAHRASNASAISHDSAQLIYVRNRLVRVTGAARKRMRSADPRSVRWTSGCATPSGPGRTP
jgi:WD40 repeat protein